MSSKTYNLSYRKGIVSEFARHDALSTGGKLLHLERSFQFIVFGRDIIPIILKDN